jgi:hypothetical protein
MLALAACADPGRYWEHALALVRSAGDDAGAGSALGALPAGIGAAEAGAGNAGKVRS